MYLKLSASNDDPYTLNVLSKNLVEVLEKTNFGVGSKTDPFPLDGFVDHLPPSLVKISAKPSDELSIILKVEEEDQTYEPELIYTELTAVNSDPGFMAKDDWAGYFNFNSKTVAAPNGILYISSDDNKCVLTYSESAEVLPDLYFSFLSVIRFKIGDSYFYGKIDPLVKLTSSTGN